MDLVAESRPAILTVGVGFDHEDERKKNGMFEQ